MKINSGKDMNFKFFLIILQTSQRCGDVPYGIENMFNIQNKSN